MKLRNRKGAQADDPEGDKTIDHTERLPNQVLGMILSHTKLDVRHNESHWPNGARWKNQETFLNIMLVSKVSRVHY